MVDGHCFTLFLKDSVMLVTSSLSGGAGAEKRLNNNKPEHLWYKKLQDFKSRAIGIGWKRSAVTDHPKKLHRRQTQTVEKRIVYDHPDSIVSTNHHERAMKGTSGETRLPEHKV